MIFRIISLVIALTCFSLHAEEINIKKLGKIDQFKKMPISGLAMVETNNKTYIVSDNGRYVLKGEMFDLWSGKGIKTIEDISIMNSIPVSKLKQALPSLAKYSFGKGEKEIYIFVDPNCPYCKQLIDDIKFVDDYKFTLIILPILGDKSTTSSTALWCAKDQKKALASLLNFGGYLNLEQNKNCNTDPLKKSLITAQVFGIDRVPYIIRWDGQVRQGVPQDLAQYLGE